MSFSIPTNYSARQSLDLHQRKQFVPANRKLPNPPLNMTFNFPSHRTIPPPNNQSLNMSPVKRNQVVPQANDRVKEMTNDLARLKKQLNDIMDESDKKRQSLQQEKKDNSTVTQLKSQKEKTNSFIESEGRFDRFPTLNMAPKKINHTTVETIHVKIYPTKPEITVQDLQAKHENEVKKFKLSNESLYNQMDSKKKEIKDKNQRLVQFIKKNKELETFKEESLEKEKILNQRIAGLEEELVKYQRIKKDNYNHVLKDQLQQIAYFKEMLSEKNSEIKKLNDTILLNKRETGNAINDSNVQKIKYLGQIKQEKQKNQIELLARENEIKTMKNALSRIEGKLKVAVEDNKKKDEFIQTHLVGRMKLGSEQQYVRQKLREYEITFPVNALAQKLLEQQREIEELKKRLIN